MGFFSNIKKNLQHGGVHLRLDGPADIHLQDQTANLTVTLENKLDQPAQINSLTVELKFDEIETNGEIGRMNQKVCEIENTNQFQLQPNETKAIPVILPISTTGLVEQADGAIPEVATQAAKIAAKLMDVGQTMSQLSGNNNKKYYFYAAADVDGVSLDPSAHLDVHVLLPGEFGIGKNFHI